jgi:hypothetical protein
MSLLNPIETTPRQVVEAKVAAARSPRRKPLY